MESLAGRPYFDEIRDLYYDVAEVMNKKIFVNYKNMIVLPRDIFGGIANIQLGGGHSSDYWFRGNRRINKVSMEAFAGYCEYKAILSDPIFQDHLKRQITATFGSAVKLDGKYLNQNITVFSTELP